LIPASIGTKSVKFAQEIPEYSRIQSGAILWLTMCTPIEHWLFVCSQPAWSY